MSRAKHFHHNRHFPHFPNAIQSNLNQDSGYSYPGTPADWIPIDVCNDNEILILANDTGDRYTSFTCTVANAGQYTVEVYGGAAGDTLLNTQTLNTAVQWSYQFTLGAGKTCSLGYTTFKIRIFSTSINNALLGFTVAKHASTATTYNRWLLVNFNTSNIANIVCNIGTSVCVELKYANTYRCNNISTGYCFSGCLALVSVTMPTHMNKLTGGFGNGTLGAFYNCSSLTTILLPIEMNSIECFGGYNTGGVASYGAFQGCTALQTIILPRMSSLKYFGGYAASGIGWGAFYGCTALTSVVFPNELSSLLYFGGAISISVSSGAFAGCTSLQTVVLPINMPAITIMVYSFYGCSALTSIVLPSIMDACTNITSIFQNCTSLTSVTMPTSMTACATIERKIHSCQGI